MSPENRVFQDVDPATITAPMPFAVGLFGYTGTGKTVSALRLARGIQRVYGGDIFFADTDNGRGLHYRKNFDFRYIDFRPPHNALDFAKLLASYEGKRGVLVIDQMTEEHEGEGGLIDTHEDVKQGKDSRTAVAWGVAKAQHKILARTLKRVMASIPVIVCWRAQKKLDWSHKNDRGKTEPKDLGEMPIGSIDLPFEMTAAFFLPPGANGAPCLAPELDGEKMMTKIPSFFRALFHPGDALTEEHGERMAAWAMGSAAATFGPVAQDLKEQIDRAPDDATIASIGNALRAAARARTITPAEQKTLAEAGATKKALLASSGKRPPSESPPEPSPTARQPGED